MCGKKKQDDCLAVIRNGSQEPDLSKIENIARGHRFESEALDHFMKESKATVKRCGFFKDPTDRRFGASPDALGPAGILVQVKARAA